MEAAPETISGFEKKAERIGLFAGTTEGRLLAWHLRELALPADVFTATEYGKEEIGDPGSLTIHSGRLDEDEMAEQFLRNGDTLIFDATHPYAREVSENIRRACKKAGIRWVRVVRDKEAALSGEEAFSAGIVSAGEQARSGEEAAALGKASAGNPEWIEADSLEEIVSFLDYTEGNILVTTGSKELSAFCRLSDFETRVYARILPDGEVLSGCARMGFPRKHLIAMEGPFSMELNLALLKSFHIRWMVTKDSGKAGGFPEKAEAARQAGVRLAVVRRPREEGISLKEALRQIDGMVKKEEAARDIYLVGTGPGNPELLTKEARNVLSQCSLIAGSARCLHTLSRFHPDFQKEMLEEYRPEGIFEYLKKHPEHKTVGVALSGDTGFYSGAAAFFQKLKGIQGVSVHAVPGISSVNYFFARIGRPWDQTALLSLHGREADVLGALRKNGQVFLLGGGKDVLKKVCGRLLAAGFSDVRITVGENLSLENERIFSGTPEQLSDLETGSLTVLFLELERENGLETQISSEATPKNSRSTKGEEINGGPRILTHGLSDDEFLRGTVPMTKQEVRAVALAKLRLTEHAVFWDVGAGTGSVSVECARLSDTVQVYAADENPEAVRLLYENRDRFGLENLSALRGTAPGCLKELPPPTHVFVGGSKGGLKEILETALKKNPRARFVVTAVTMETAAAMTGMLNTLPVKEEETVLLTAARSKAAGNSHLMMGQNPVWIFTFSGTGLEAKESLEKESLEKESLEKESLEKESLENGESGR